MLLTKTKCRCAIWNLHSQFKDVIRSLKIYVPASNSIISIRLKGFHGFPFEIISSVFNYFNEELLMRVVRTYQSLGNLQPNPQRYEI